MNGSSGRENDIDFEPDEFRRDLGIAVVASFCPAILDRDRMAIDPPSSPSLRSKAATYEFQDKRVLAPRNPIIGSLPACCARAASGHATAPPSSVMNARRFMQRSRPKIGTTLLKEWQAS